ncbi:MAG: hypothetical protein U1F10_01145 [Burkholderiales bacterium]
MSAEPTTPAPILLADSVTRLGPEHAGAVVVTGSHGGLIAAAYLAAAGVRAALANDAGRGRDDAGVAGLAALDGIGIAAAAVTHASARIGDARDTFDRGVVSIANPGARAVGVEPGMTARRAAVCLAHAPWSRGRLASPAEQRITLVEGASPLPAITGLDSIGLVEDADAGQVLVIGSHGALHGGDPASALPVAAAGAFFHDAGRGRDDAGVTRLPVLAARGMPAATADFRSARIGDARSLWETGLLSCVNEVADRAGLRTAMRVRDAALRLREQATAGRPR